MTYTSGTKQAFREFRITWCGDPWGHTMHWWFTVADELYWREGYTPEDWEYKPSPLGSTNDPDDYATQVCMELDAETLVRFGNVLGRYAKKLKRAGMDY